MPILEIKKRNGNIVPFDAVKITAAMRNAFIASDEPITEEALEGMTVDVVRMLEDRFPEYPPSVEHTQDFVELTLMRNGHLEIAKHYIVYRHEHAKIREEKTLERLMRDMLGADEVDTDAILEQLKFELYEGMTTDEVRRALIAVVRSMIERDPAYSLLAARLLLDRLYGEVFGPEYDSAKPLDSHDRVFVRNMTHLVEEGNLDERMAEFDLGKLEANMR